MTETEKGYRIPLVVPGTMYQGARKMPNCSDIWVCEGRSMGDDYVQNPLQTEQSGIIQAVKSAKANALEQDLVVA